MTTRDLNDLVPKISPTAYGAAIGYEKKGWGNMAKQQTPLRREQLEKAMALADQHFDQINELRFRIKKELDKPY